MVGICSYFHIPVLWNEDFGQQHEEMEYPVVRNLCCHLRHSNLWDCAATMVHITPTKDHVNFLAVTWDNVDVRGLS